MNAQTGFWFPSMKIVEIVVALKEWGLHVSEDQIQRPTADVVQAIYVLFLQQITGITPESLQEPVNRAVAVIGEHPELYTASLNLNLVLHHTQRLGHAARVQDLTMRDLVSPEPERTRNIMSAIINFVKFVEERGGFLRKLRDQSTSALEERERMQHKVAELKQKIAEIKKQRQADEPRCLALRKDNDQIGINILAIQNAKAQVSREVDARKKDKSELSRQRENLMREIEHVTTSINTTRSRIVQSPDRIKKHISEMGLMAQDERMIIAAAEAKSRELKIKLDALNVFEQDMKKLIDDLRMIQSEHIHVENIQHKLATFRDELDRKFILREQLLGRSDRAKRQMRNAEDKLQRAQQHAEDRRGKSEDEIARLKKDYEEMSEERRENDKQVEETKQEAAELERKMQDHLRKNEAELNELLNEYWGLRHQTEVYMETLANKLGMDLA
ncbi:Nuf2 family-domain-containing protein [Phellopilus nigrolimitatus]|nr:Nuf2 family-domain-containing protein [Phellopilus nigrolimitatus]